MTNRLTLHKTLTDILGSGYVYYNPPESTKMSFPCIVYKLNNIIPTHADNMNYIDHTVYKITVISKQVDHPAVKKILKLPRTRFSTSFTANGFYHYVIILNQQEEQ